MRGGECPNTSIRNLNLQACFFAQCVPPNSSVITFFFFGGRWNERMSDQFKTSVTLKEECVR